MVKAGRARAPLEFDFGVRQLAVWSDSSETVRPDDQQHPRDTMDGFKAMSAPQHIIWYSDKPLGRIVHTYIR